MKFESRYDMGQEVYSIERKVDGPMVIKSIGMKHNPREFYYVVETHNGRIIEFNEQGLFTEQEAAEMEEKEKRNAIAEIEAVYAPFKKKARKKDEIK